MEKVDKAPVTNAAMGTLGAFAMIFVFLAPLKFGVAVGTPDFPLPLPGNPISLAIFQWPPTLFSILAGVLLLAAEILSPSRLGPIGRSWALALVWIDLALSALPGFINGPTLDFPVVELSHLTGLAAFALALKKILDARPDLKLGIVTAVSLSTVLIAIIGLDQYLYGFGDTLKYMEQREKLYGIVIPDALRIRLRETRVYATFSICNTLAGHLLLVAPVTIWAIWSRKKTLVGVIVVLAVAVFFETVGGNTPRFLIVATAAVSATAAILALKRFPEDAKKARIVAILVLVPIVALLCFIFGATHSRGAFAALSATLLFAILALPFKNKRLSIYTLGVCAFTAVVAIPFAWRDIISRGFSSMWVRLDYFKVALRLFLKHPLAGSGWGGFFQGYQMLKTFPGEEAPHTPHNFVLNFASQAGALGLAAALTVLLLPIILFILASKDGKRKREEEHASTADGELPSRQLRWLVLAGWCGWAAHSLVDFDMQVPGTVATAIALLLCVDWGVGRSGAEKTGSVDMKGTSMKWSLPIRAATLFLAATAIVVSWHRLSFDAEFAKLLDATNQRPTTARPGVPPLSEKRLDAMLAKCAEIAPYSPFPILGAVNHLMATRRWAKAEFLLKKALKLSPRRSSTYYKLYVVEKHLGKRGDALRNLEKAAELFPNAYRKILEEEKKGAGLTPDGR